MGLVWRLSRCGTIIELKQEINRLKSVEVGYLRKAKAATLNHILSEHIKRELKYNK
jgi:hypothetical protein